MDNYGAIIDFIAGINVTQSSKQMKKDMIKMKKAITAFTKVDIQVGIDKKELAEVEAQMIAFSKKMSLKGTELSNTTISPFKIKDEDTNKIKEMATVTSQYKNELGQLVTVTGTLNRATGAFDGQLKETVKSTKLTEFEINDLKQELELSKKEINANVVALKQFGTSTQHAQLDKLNSKVKQLSINSGMTQKEVTGVTSALKTAKREMKAVGVEAKAQGKASLTFGQQLKNAVKGFGIWSAVTVAYYKAVEGIKVMVTQVKDLDDALVELSKVTTMSKSELSEFSAEAEIAGDRVNSSASKITQASADFARMGFSSEMSMGLAEDAILLTKIADGITEVSEASTAMISILKGFNMEADQSRYIIDSINEVSNNFAINTDDLADGLRRTAGVMKETGVSFEDTIGLLVAGQESLQNIEKVSSGLITISTRLRGVKTDGEEIDGLIPKLTASFRDFAQIDIQKQNGDLKNTKDILTELKPKWEGMNDEQRAYLSFLLSGTRQSPVLLAMMSNLSNGMDASASATNSAGSALKEYKKYSESLQGKLDELGATWTQISTDMVSSEFLGWLLDVANAMSKVIEQGEFLKTLGTSLSPFAMTISNLKKSMDMTGDLLGIDTTIDINSAKDKQAQIDILSESFRVLAGRVKEVTEEEEKLAEVEPTDMELLKDLVGYDEAVSRINDINLAMDTLNKSTLGGNYSLTQFQKELKKLQNQIAPVTQAEEDQAEALKQKKKAIYEAYAEYRRTISQSDDVVKSYDAISYALDEYISNGKVSENTMYDLSNSQEFLDLALNSTKGEIVSLAKQWGMSTDDITDFMESTTDSLITKIGIQISAIELLKTTLASIGTENNVFSVGSDIFGRKDVLAGKGLEQRTGGMFSDEEAQLKNLLESLRNRNEEFSTMFDDSVSTSDGSDDKKDEVEEYSNQLEKLTALQYELNVLEGYASVHTEQYYDERVAKLKEIQAELNRLNIADRLVKDGMKEGTEEYDDLLEIIHDRSLEWLETQEQIDSVINDQVETVAELAEKYQEDLNTVLETTVELIKSQKEEYVDSLEARKESLKLAKEEEDIQKSLKALAKDKTELENEKFQLELDGSQSNSARILEIEDLLSDKQDEIDEELADNKYDRTVDLLDDEIDAVEDYLDDDLALRKDALDKLTQAFNGETNELYLDLLDWNSKYGTSIQSDIVDMWGSAKTAFNSYKDLVGDDATFGGALQSNSDAKIISEMQENSWKWTATKNQDKKDEYVKANEDKALGLSFTAEKTNGAWYNKDTGMRIYDTGGRVESPETAMLAQNGIPETIITDTQMPQFLKNAIAMALPKMSDTGSGTTSSNDNYDVKVIIQGGIDSEDRANYLAKKVAKVLKDTSNKRGNKAINVM